MSAVRLPGREAAVDQVAPLAGRPHLGPAQACARQDRAPDVHWVQPRPRIRPPGEHDLRPLGGAPRQPLLRMMLAGVVHQQRPAPVRITPPPRTQDVATCPRGGPRVAVPEDRARAPSEGRPHVDDTRPHRLELPALDRAGAAWPGRVEALQGWPPGLLVEAPQTTVLGRVHRPCDPLCHRRLTLRIGAGQPVANPRGLQPHVRHKPLDRRRTPRHAGATAGPQPGHVAPAVVRAPAAIPLPLLRTCHPDHQGTGLRGNKPGDVPLGAQPPGPAAAPGAPPPA